MKADTHVAHYVRTDETYKASLLKSGKQRMIANDLEVSGSGLVIVIS
jgi:uncharacterized protein YlxW (UPF0749 family)